MRIALVLALLLAFAGCGKKKSAQSPANASPAAGEPADEMKEKKAADEADDATPLKSSDPCEGGE